MLIASATGVPRGYYGKFASHLAQRGLPALTFDYRGIGGSRANDLRNFSGRMHHWGERDLAGAIDWLTGQSRASRLMMVGHSVAGQVLPLAANAGRLGAVLLVGSQSGVARFWSGFDYLRLMMAWYLLFPALTATLGRIPGWVMGGEPIPAGIAREWARWGRHPHYILSHGPAVRNAFSAFSAPIRFYSFADDFYAPRPAVEDLISWYGSAAKEHHHITPHEIGVPKIGHFGFFNERFSKLLWPDAVNWLLDQTRISG